MKSWRYTLQPPKLMRPDQSRDPAYGRVASYLMSMQQQRIGGVHCPVHGKNNGTLVCDSKADVYPSCAHSGCRAVVEVLYVKVHHPLIASLYLLMRSYFQGDFTAEYSTIQIKSSRGHVHIEYQADQSQFRVHRWNFSGTYDLEGTFPIEHPKAVGAAIRCTARLLKQEMPSFDSIDLLLAEGPPQWFIDEYGLATDG